MPQDVINNVTNYMHPHVKERKVNGTEYFHVHVKSVISKRKIESQRYFVFNHSSKKFVSRSDALEMANRKALHLCHRHEQIRRARTNRLGLIASFFNSDGTPCGISICKTKKTNRNPYIEIKIQKMINKKIYRRIKTIPRDAMDNEIIFNIIFNEQFNFLCESLQVNKENFHVQLFKDVIKTIMLDKLKTLAKSI